MQKHAKLSKVAVAQSVRLYCVLPASTHHELHDCLNTHGHFPLVIQRACQAEQCPVPGGHQLLQALCIGQCLRTAVQAHHSLTPGECRSHQLQSTTPCSIWQAYTGRLIMLRRSALLHTAVPQVQ